MKLIRQQACVALLAASGWFLLPPPKALAGQPSEVFPVGETLVYEVRWDPPLWMFFLPTMTAGEMTLRFNEMIRHEGQPAYKITADAVSSGFLPKLTGVTIKDYFESIVDSRDFCSVKMTKITREGKRHRDVFLTFDRKNGTGHYLAYDVGKDPPVELKNESVKGIPPCVQDLLSAIYHTRLQGLKVGEIYPVVISDNGQVKRVEVKVQKRELVQAAAGNFEALKVETVSVFGGLFKGGGTFFVWVSDDAARIPVKFEAKVKLGKVFGTLSRMERTLNTQLASEARR
ncbi:MAG: DUF3108 domain-containing protein [Acidobacteriota bacterium]